jgi:hypothetical protein
MNIFLCLANYLGPEELLGGGPGSGQRRKSGEHIGLLSNYELISDKVDEC